MTNSSQDSTRITVRHAIDLGTRFLKSKDLLSPRLDTEVILCSLLGCDRTYLFAHPEVELPDPVQAQFKEWLKKRGGHYPLQYLRGIQEFFGMDFLVNSHVLIPRPETELVVETALRLLDEIHGVSTWVLDVGTGSGCIAVSLARLRPDLRVIALDISAEALKVASANARRGGCEDRVDLVCSDLLAAIQPVPHFDLVVANPPYVAWEDFPITDPSVRQFEPALAVFSPEQGLGVTKRLLHQAGVVLKGGAHLVVELGQGPQENLVKHVSDEGWEVEELLPDLAGRPRCAVLVRAAR